MKDFKPHPYQELIIDHILRNPRCAVYAGMGLGKSSSTLTALEAMRLYDDAPALVLAPLRVAEHTWPDEVHKWAQFRDMRVSAIVGNPRQRIAALNTPADIYTTNYENVPWLVDTLGAAWPFRKIVADESTKLKSFRLRQGGKRAQSLARVAHEYADVFIELTGTPCPNSLIDLWGQVWFVDRGLRLGRTFGAFRDRWFRQHPSGFGYEALPNAQREIEALLRDVCITIKAEDWFDISAPIVNNIYVDMPATRDGVKLRRKVIRCQYVPRIKRHGRHVITVKHDEAL